MKTKHSVKLLIPFLRDKVRSTNKMISIDNEEIIVGDYITAKVFLTLSVTLIPQNIRTANLLLTISVILFSNVL